MKIIEHTTTNLILKDSAGCFWLFGLFFVLIAGTFVAGLMGLFNNLNELNELERLAAWIVSLSGVAAGVWIIYSSPSSFINFDKRESTVTIHKKGLLVNNVEKYPFQEILEIKLAESKDSDGDSVFIIEMKLKLGKTVKLTHLWIQKKDELQNNLDTINEFIV
jgi:hypothetical protein